MKKSKTVIIQEYELPIKITEEKEGGFVATCPIWNDCYAQGDTIEEAITEISSVATSLLDLYKEEGFKIPLKLKKTTANAPSYDLTFTIPVVISS